MDEDFEQELYDTDIFEDDGLYDTGEHDDDPNPYDGTYSEE